MAKVAVLVPFRDMCEIGRSLVGDYPFQTMCVEYVQTDEIAARAAALQEAGCDLIVSRGLHARVVRGVVSIPVVEMRITAQELGMVMLELKQKLAEETPCIGIIGFGNMFCDTSSFNTLFGIRLQNYMVEHSSELTPTVERAMREGCQAVIGGEVVCEHARLMGIPCRFTPAGVESMRIALDTAERICYALDREKRNSAEMDAMLNYTFSGIMQVDAQGVVRRVNRACMNLLGLTGPELLDRPVGELLPGLNHNMLQQTLQEGGEKYAFVMDLAHKAVVVNLAPIRVDGALEGAVFTFQEGKRIREMDSELRRELYQRGFIAKYSFEKLVCNDRETQKLIATAKRIAKFSAPVLLVGDAGTGKEVLAQCIHNESLRRNNAFITVDCSAWMPETLDNMLFGNYSARRSSADSMAELAQDGTLYLSHVECLPAETQYKLLNLIQGRLMLNGTHRPAAANVRVIASSPVNLVARISSGEFRSDLYYALGVLSLELLPLRRRREDIPGWLEYYLREWQDKYTRYVHLSQGAQSFLQGYDWPGNLNQMNSLCERMVLLAEHRNIDEAFVRQQLELVTPHMLPGTERAVLYKDRKAVEIAALLRKHNGNREKVAAELGISKTTLWRHIKKYGIGPDYNY